MNIYVMEEQMMKIKMNIVIGMLLVIATLILAGCAGKSTLPAKVPEVLPGILQGYLLLKTVPNSDALLPAPPAGESAAFKADQEAFRKLRSLKNTPRWALASKDANLNFPKAAEAFSCAMNVLITEESTPYLYMILRRTMTDAVYATFKAKHHYNRIRPFVVHRESSCTPNEEPELAKEGSYPSGHASIGWAWALILAEIAPEHSEAILKRGYAFGQSRVICGVHWQSDVDAGRLIAAAVVAKLHSDPVFHNQVEIAKKELAQARAKGLSSTNDCKAEAAALVF
jgi:acid phosphatase (class A)